MNSLSDDIYFGGKSGYCQEKAMHLFISNLFKLKSYIGFVSMEKIWI
ncbi:MAG: hypothetical protein AAFW70_20240 [Cyanobacteria bacterium J06635_10]